MKVQELFEALAMSDEVAAKKIFDKIKGTPNLNVANTEKLVRKYLSMVGKNETDVKYLLALVMAEIEDMDALTEGETPDSFEIKDIVKNFPSKYDKMLRALWGKDKLTYKGQKLFTEDDLGPVYHGAMKAAEKAMKNITVELEVTDPKTGHDDLMLEIALEEDSQEVYLGYDPKGDNLYIGYDVWLDEEDYNEKYAYKYDDSDPEVEKALNNSWEVFKEFRPQGLLFKLETTDGIRFRAEEVEDARHHKSGLFYQTVYKAIKAGYASVKLIDLRLD